MQVDGSGYLANWMIRGRDGAWHGWAMDLVTGAKRGQHTAKGKPKVLYK